MAYQDIFQKPLGISDDFDPLSGLQNFQTLSGTSELLNFQKVQSVKQRQHKETYLSGSLLSSI
jgi:hypothetical protein